MIGRKGESESATREEAGGEAVDIEEYGKTGRPVPGNAQRFKIKVDKQIYEVGQPLITGAEILRLAGKTPSGYRLDMKLHGGQTKKIEPTDVVDLRQPGLEKFMTLPLDQTEGASPNWII